MLESFKFAIKHLMSLSKRAARTIGAIGNGRGTTPSLPPDFVPLSLVSDKTYNKMAWITGIGLKEILEKQMNKQTYVLTDQNGNGEKVTVQVEALVNDNALAIHPAGTGCYDDEDSAPILLELYNGKIRLLVWNDINCQDPTIIDLSEALEKNRVQTVDGV